ncbi:MAG: siphovirus Gp157 family protein [Ruminococcus sp.]|nr:siphovirus Gp157 family protein [Ruminococcus sp.]
MTLYEIDTQISECIDSETGEVIDVDKLSVLVMERDTKLENVALWIKNLDGTAKAIRTERDVLKTRQEQAEHKSDLLREWLSKALDGEKMETPKVRVFWRKSTAVEVDDRLPKKWCSKKIVYTPDKVAIKTAISNGKKITGAKIVERQNIQIK